MDGQRSLNAYDVGLQVVGLAEQGDNGLFVGIQLRKQRPFYAVGLCLLQLNVIIPAHRFYEILGASDESRPVVAYQIVASGGVGCANRARKGKYIAAIAARDVRGDESAALACRLHKHRCIGHTGHNTVAPHEVWLVGIGH